MTDGAANEDDLPEELEDELSNFHDGLRTLLLRPVEARLKVPHSTILLLLQESTEWVCISKLGLLVEAALTEYLVLELGRPDAYEHISGSDQAKRLTLADAPGMLCGCPEHVAVRSIGPAVGSIAM